MNKKIDICEVFASYFDTELRALAYAIYQKLEEGSICLDIKLYNKERTQVPNLNPNPYLKENELLKIPNENNPFITKDVKLRRPFVVFNQKVYLYRYFFYETVIIEQIKNMIENENKHSEHLRNLLLKNRYLVNQLFPDKDNTINWQKNAAIISCLHNFSIITGGPGTGKTTTVAKIIILLLTIFPDLKIALAAPTGKAATRLNESIKKAGESLSNINEELIYKIDQLSATTIHRLLKSKRNSPYFHHDKEHPLSFDVIITDESSMIDAALLAKLLMAIPSENKLIMLGDKDQLASVEAGSVFGDLCYTNEKLNGYSPELIDFINSFNLKLPENTIVKNKNLLTDHITELTESYRFQNQTGIGLLSKAIISGQLKLSDIRDKYQDYSLIIDEKYSETAFNSFCDGYKEFINEPDIKKALNKLNNIRILCALKEGNTGVHEYNKKVEFYLSSKAYLKTEKGFYENQPVMITANDYNLGLFNGDTGIIRKDDKGKLFAWFEDHEGNIKAIVPDFLQSWETVYAMTVHKSQGSEFEKVVIILPKNQDISILTKELLYTAITRAKTRVLIQGSLKTIIKTSGHSVKRASGINQRI